MGNKFERDIYLLSTSQLTPETIAVTFAKTSRSPLSFREIASELGEEESSEFHEKWVVGYGHGSVAEHAVLHIAFENVSRLAVECIESNRLASYTEKSTRYQKWAPGGYFIPAEVSDSKYETLYRETLDRLFAVYQESLEPVKAVVQQAFPRKEGESDESWDGRIRSKYVDACRFLLPAASLANVGMTVNARSLEHAIRKMLSHPLQEVRDIGVQVKEVSRQETPTLVKYAAQNPYLTEMQATFSAHARDLEPEVGEEMLQLVHFDEHAEDGVLAAALYAEAGCSYHSAMKRVRGCSQEERSRLAGDLLGGMDRFDAPGRALEHAVYTFEALLDQGAYFELKRHRMMTQTPQVLRADLGYAVPALIRAADVEEGYILAMEAAKTAFDALHRWNPYVASYLVPNGFNRRVLLTLNLREVFHFCELRARPNAHFSIRRLSLRMAELVQGVHPLLGSYLRLPEGANWQGIERDHFVKV